jgi:prolipoprotein diacylglyceryltransferase
MIWHWQFDPIALHVGPLQLHWYGVLFALAFVLGQQLLAWCYRREDYDSQALDSLMPWALIGTVLGARLAHCLIYDPAYYPSPPSHTRRMASGWLR